MIIIKPDVTETKCQIADAMLDLMKNKPFTKITVDDICRKSRLSRRTFYNYFIDKNDVVSYIWTQVLRSSWYENDKLCGFERYVDNFLAYSRSMGNFFPAAFEYTEQNNIREIMFNTSLDGLLALIKQNGYEDEIDNEIIQILRFFVYGLVGYAEEMIFSFKQHKDDDYIEEHYFTGSKEIEFLPERIKPLILTVKPSMENN